MLTALKVKSLKKPGKHADRDSLYLNITKGGNKSWIYRYQLDGRRREMGLGSIKNVSLIEARELAADARKLHKRGVDPKTQRDSDEARSQNLTFKECAEAYIESHRIGWKNPKHVSQWSNTLTQYAYPSIGNAAIDKVDTSQVMAILRPIWNTKNETASRVRGRIENILSWATVQGYREGPNPAMWRGHLAMLLPKGSVVQEVKHHAAIPYVDMPKFMNKLAQSKSISASALNFVILTCARTSEVIGAQWNEVWLEEAVWTIPAARMKAGREHRVALSSQAIALLSNLPREGDWLFVGLKKNSHISNMAMLKFLQSGLQYPDFTVHGFRSTFRDWAAEVSHFPRELAESALAHALTNKVEAAYQRGDLLVKRRAMMQAWADYLDADGSFGKELL